MPLPEVSVFIAKPMESGLTMQEKRCILCGKGCLHEQCLKCAAEFAACSDAYEGTEG